MSEFTKGKWKCENGYWYRITDEEGLIAICTRNKPSARLIAPAPEMYKLLEDIAWYLEQIADDDDENAKYASRSKALLARIDGEDEEEQS